MKKFLLLCAIILGVVALFNLSRCTTEEIIKLQTIKVLPNYDSLKQVWLSNQGKAIDTVTVMQLIAGTKDTVYINKIIYEKDTIIQNQVAVIHDTIEIYHVTIIHDTVNQRVYTDTLILYQSGKPYIATELREQVDWFLSECDRRNLETNSDYSLVVAYAYQTDIPTTWWSYSFLFGNNYFVRVRPELTTDASFTPIIRELARIKLGKDYSSDPNNIMNPIYNPNTIRYSNKEQYINEINKLFE